MRPIASYLSSLLLAAALVASVAGIGCTARASGTIKGTSNRTTTIDSGAAQAANVQQNNGAQSQAGH